MISFTTITLFPELFPSWLEAGLMGQAYSKKLFQYSTINPRQFTSDIHHSVDDKAYGGGDGMVLSFDPWSKAIDQSLNENLMKHNNSKIVFLTPQGPTWNQQMAQQWLKSPLHITFVCGRYAGFDQRLIQHYTDHHQACEVSIGDYILNGGELSAMVLMETLVRGIPGALGSSQSFEMDSFSGTEGLLECPSFTRPQQVVGLKVPDFLTSGNHREIEKMKAAVSLVRTYKRRPELVKKSKEQLEEALRLVDKLSSEEKKLLGIV